MIVLKQLIRYDNAPVLEGTWVERTQRPDVEIPAVLDEAGNVTEPARTEPGGIQETIVKCRVYGVAEFDDLAADLRADAPQYQALMDEVAATYVPPAPEPPHVPTSVSPRQIRQALNRVTYGAGTLRDAVEAAVAAGSQDTKDWWEFATEFRRDNPEVLAMGQGLGVSAAQMDELWILAGSL